jgi:hypothetical protein
MMKTGFFLLFLVFFTPLTAGMAGAAEPPPVVVELFTSQSCDSCPAADEILGEIAHNPDNGLIVLGCHVTTWDHLRWRDTLSLEICSERQRDYGAQLEQGRTYTPQMVVNGKYSFVGSRQADLDKALRKAKQENKVERIGVTMSDAGFTIELPDLPAGQHQPYELSLITYMTNRPVSITAGENRGKDIVYAHAVSGIRRLDPWQGAAETRVIGRETLPAGHLHGVAIVAQPIKGGAIRAAGEYRIYFN